MSESVPVAYFAYRRGDLVTRAMHGATPGTRSHPQERECNRRNANVGRVTIARPVAFPMPMRITHSSRIVALMAGVAVAVATR